MFAFYICRFLYLLLLFIIFAFYICRFLYLPHWADVVIIPPPPLLSTSRRRRGHAFQNIGHFLMSGAKKNWQMAILWLKVSAQETSDQGLSSRCSITTCCFGRSRRRPSFQSWQLFNNFETTLEQLWDNFGTTFFLKLWDNFKTISTTCSRRSRSSQSCLLGAAAEQLKCKILTAVLVLKSVFVINCAWQAGDLRMICEIFCEH